MTLNRIVQAKRNLIKARAFAEQKEREKKTKLVAGQLKAEFSRCPICQVPLGQNDSVKWCFQTSRCPEVSYRESQENYDRLSNKESY